MEKKQLILIMVAALAIIGSVARLIITRSDGSSRGNPLPYGHLGTVVGEETVKLLGGKGSVVVVLEVIEGVKNPNNDDQVKGFKAGLAKSKGVTLKEVKELKRDMSNDPRFWPEEQAARIVSMGAGADAVVLFVHFPSTLPAKDIAALKDSKKAILAVTTQSPLLDSLIGAGAIRAAVAIRIPPKPLPAGKENPAQWFDRVYTVLKAP